MTDCGHTLVHSWPEISAQLPVALSGLPRRQQSEIRANCCLTPPLLASSTLLEVGLLHQFPEVS